MEKESLYIKRLNDDGEAVLFPSSALPAIIGTYEYNATRMGGAPTIEAEVYYPSCLDSEWTYKEYVEFNGEKFYVSQVPSSSKDNTDQRYKHDITFTSERIVLENIYAYDVVTGSTEEQYADRYRNNTTTFSFYGDINEFVARINDSLVYSDVLTVSTDDDGNKVYDGFYIVVDDGVETDSLEVSFEDLKVSEALQEIYNIYGLTYYWDGKVCHVGDALDTIEDAFEYGQEGGLLSVEKTNDNTEMVDRVTGYGGTTNIQYYYPNTSASGTATYTVENVDESLVTGVNLSKILKYLSEYEGVTLTFYHSAYVPTLLSSIDEFELYDEDEVSTDTTDMSIYIAKITETTQLEYSTHFSAKLPASVMSSFYLADLDFATSSSSFGTKDAQHMSMSAFLMPFSKDVPESASEALEVGYQNIVSGTAFLTEDVNVDYRLVVYVEYSAYFDGDFVPSGMKYIPGWTINITFSGTVQYKYTAEKDRYFFSYGDDEDDTVEYSSSGVTLKDYTSVPYATRTYTTSGTGAISYEDADTDTAAKITITGREWMTVSSKLMPSIYRETLGADRFYPAVNYPTEDGSTDDRYVIPDDEDGNYYEFENEYEKGNPHEGITEDEDIYPTIKGVYNSSGELIAEMLDFAYDEDFNDTLTDDSDEEDPEYIHSYFYAKLRVFDGDYGFNLFEYASASEEAYVTLTSGNCSACAFQIAVEKKENDDGTAYTFYNPVLTDEEGELLKQTKYEPGDSGYLGDYILAIDQIDDPDEDYTARQQDTSKCEVWVALKRDNETFGVVMPNYLNSYYPSAGDSFVLTGIYMPQTYIDAAERRLDEYLIQYMWENNTESFSYTVKFSRIWIAEHEDIAARINENALMAVKYNGIEHWLYVSDYTCKADDNILYEIEVELTEELSLSSGTLRSEVDGLKSIVAASSSSASTTSSSSVSGEASSLTDALLAELKKIFLSRTDNDTAEGLITFLKGLAVGSGKHGIDALGNATLASVTSSDFSELEQTGYGIRNVSGVSYAYFHNLEVWGKAIFNQLEVRKLSAVGGSIVLSPSCSTIFYVEEYEVDGEMAGWKCYYLADDNTMATQNNWQVGDQARCQSFNVDEGTYENVVNKDYWRCVIAVSSANECIYGDNGEALYDGQEFGWVALSLTNAQTSDYGSTLDGAEQAGTDAQSTPAAGDIIVQEGHQIQDDDNSDELNRMNMILFTAADDNPGIYMYQGIYTFSLDGRCVAKTSPSGWEILSSFFTWSTGSVTVPNYVDMGEWTDGSTATQYTIWYYEGNTWRYDGEDSTTEAPSTDVSGWVQLTYNSTADLARAIYIELSLGGQMYYDETETVTLSVWDVTKTTEYTDGYTFSVERDSGDDNSDAVWNASFAANYDGGNTFTISFSDLNFVDGSRTTKFWVYATETETGEELEEEVIEY